MGYLVCTAWLEQIACIAMLLIVGLAHRMAILSSVHVCMGPHKAVPLHGNGCMTASRSDTWQGMVWFEFMAFLGLCMPGVRSLHITLHIHVTIIFTSSGTVVVLLWHTFPADGMYSIQLGLA